MDLTQLSIEKQRIIEWIESEQNNLIQFLQELVAIPSDNPPGDCYEIATFIYERLQDYQFNDVSFLPVDDEEVKESGMIRVANVVAKTRFGEKEGPDIVLNSHGDVVAPGQGWTQDPYGGNIVNGKLYGRGAAVSKSDIATYTFATMALRQFTERLSGQVSLAFTFDEEVGGLIGPRWLLEHGHIKPDMAISAGFTYSIVNAHNGCLHLEVKLCGKSAHAAAPHTGHDALLAMTGVLQALYGYRDILKQIKSDVPGIGSPQMTVGMISGGIHTSVVPDEVTIRIDRRIIPEEDGEEVETEIRQLIEQKVEEYVGIRAEINRILLAKNFGPTPTNTALIQTLAANWHQVMEGELSINGIPIFTDGRLFAEAGIPTVLFGAGPRTFLEANGHRADEHIKVDDLLKATKIVALTLYDLLHAQNKQMNKE